MTLSSKILLLFLSLIFISDMAGAQTSYCPKKVGYLETNPLAAEVLAKVKEYYQQLGCETVFEGYPSNRVIKLFNNGKLDGEMVRAPVAEKEYTQAFVKSRLPIYQTTMVLWGSPEAQKDGVVGYLKGVKWQEELVETKAEFANRVVGFRDHLSMINAYNRGAIDQFLFLKSPVEKLTDGYFSRARPLVQTEFDVLNLYHYLRPAYGTFMADLDRVLKASTGF